MKFIYFLIGIIFLQSCDKKELDENKILEIIHSQEGYENLELKKDFLTGEDFIDSIKSFRKIIAKENFKSIYEADFNNDGKLDYLVNLTYPKTQENDVIEIFIVEDSNHSVLLLSSDNGYQLLNPGKHNIYNIFSAKIISHKEQPIIKLVNFKRHIEKKDNLIQYDTLMIKNNQLTEYTKSIKHYHIEKIIFKQNGGYAPGIKYQLTLTADSITLRSNFYKNLKGKYIGNNNSNFKILAKHLNEINFNSLSNHYSIDCSDCSSTETEIIFDNGKRKKIYDYGEKGSLGLVRFHGKINQMMTSQKWKKLD